jgi:hypothetical protein
MDTSEPRPDRPFEHEPIVSEPRPWQNACVLRRNLSLQLLLLALTAALVLPSCSRRGSSRGGGGGGSDDDDAVATDDDDDDASDDDDAGDDDDAAGDDDDASDRDSDGDGLTDAFEESIGTDWNDRDTDGDGFEDGDEHLNYFYANDATDFPYAGDYPRGPLPSTISSQGWSEGSVSNNWTLVDQWGEELQLHRFYGNVIVVELAADW